MAEAATASVLQQLDDLTECSIHRGTYENPRQLPCLHSFCLQCLVSYTKDKPQCNDISCPLCRKEITVPSDGIEGFPRNFFIEKVIEIKRLTSPLQKDTLCDLCQEDQDLPSDVPVASMFCTECRKNLCDNCTREHRRHNKSHSVLKMGSEDISEQLAKRLEVSFCDDHSCKEVEMFCFDCHTTICMICFAENHQLHKCSEINRAAKDFRKKMEHDIEAISVCLSEGEKTKELIDKDKEDFLQQIQTVEKRILERGEELRKVIDKDSNLLFDELKLMKSGQLKDMVVKDEEIQRHLTIIASLKAYGREILAVGSASDVCRSVNQFHSRTEEVQATVEEEPFCRVVSRCVSFQPMEFQENLERNCLGKLEVNCEKHSQMIEVSIPDIKEIDAKDTFVGHESMGVSDEEGNAKPDVSIKGKEDDKSKAISLEEAVVKFSKTGDKSEYDNRCQGNQSPGAANNDTHQQPTKQRKLVHRISMDEDVYKYIKRFLHQELEEATALCNYVQELSDETSKFHLGYTVRHEANAETVRRRFQQLKDQVKTEEYKAPNRINASVLESLVHASAISEGTMTFVQSEKNSLKIVGRPDRVDILRKRIEETVSEQLQSQEQFSKENMQSYMYYPEQSFKQQSKAKLCHHIPIDKDLCTYISAHCQQEIERASKRCTSITSSQIGIKFTIDFELKDTKDEEFVKRIYKNLMGQFKSEECEAPKAIDFAGLVSVIQEMNTLKEVMIFPQEDKQLLKLIGPNTQVSKAKVWIESLISDTIQSGKLSKKQFNVTNPTVHSSSIKDQPQSSKELKPFVSTSIQKSYFGYSPRKPGEHFRISSITSDSFVYESKRVKNKLIVRVHYADIIKQRTDVLVSYEDEWLQSCTVLALAIKEAAGPDVAQELTNISKNHGRLEVGQVVHTSAGKLRPFVKHLVHAVRAQPSQHNPEDPNTFEILYKTYLNCLQCANNKLYQKSISIPPIGSHKYGVQMVSAAFNEAVHQYDAIAETTSSLISLHSIHFVDQDPAFVRLMITSIKSLIK